MKFWMVLGERGAPQYRHSSRFNAQKEALRLAANNPGQEFFVLEAVMVAHLPPNVATIRDLVETAKDVPF